MLIREDEIRFIKFSFYFTIEKYSAIGPSASPGKNSNAPSITTTENNTTPNIPESIFNEPDDSGVYFFTERKPAMAIGPIIGINLPSSIAMPVPIFQNGVLSPSPSNPEPLLAAADENS